MDVMQMVASVRSARLDMHITTKAAMVGINIE